VDAVTIRHMIVFGVCALGVGGLYLVPSVANPPAPVSIRQAADQPQPRPSNSAKVRVPQAGATGEAAQPVEADPPQTDPTRPAAVDPPPTDQPTQSSPSPTQRGRTAYDPVETPDVEPPSAVATITPAEVTADALSLTWPAATDNKRVIGYRIWLNGYEVATTAETKVKVRWFNDDEGQHVVQIKAIDAAGNQSTTWSTLLVTRPSPEPAVAPTPTPTTAPEPTSTPSPTTTQTTVPTTAPTVQGSSIPVLPKLQPTAGAR
jgi:chitinase